ncbi:nuclear transport factor 2 family protein [Natronobacterium texcoconense]|uniref:SnoaL-like domain-containing protein n=1 Tax=Natronobacterium texcoconense TaxID=1095778 RepID=A0A1H1A3Z8_NATTX|nr:nuclear transport factor 2 family protein [Natronobacterium texcoconense]SDQ34435.1 SnoaL-like domain-containing protein [Natronobacterium texcoconense]
MAETTSRDVQALVEKDAINELMARVYYLVDDGEVGEAIDRFATEDVTFDAEPLGSAEGRDAWKEWAETAYSENMPFRRHMLHNQVIEVDGDTATGKWYLDCPSVTGDGEAVWTQGTYEHEFRRVGGEWKISAFSFDFTYAAPYEKGWAAQPFIEEIPGELDW